MGRYNVLKKGIALAIIFAFLFQVDVFLYTQRGDDIEEQFRKIKESYLKEQQVGAQKRIERLMVFIDEKKLGMQKILGMCHLLLGAICERKGESELAKEHYRKAKKDYDTRKVEGVDLDSLELYKKIMKDDVTDTGGVIEGEGKKKKKKFPWLLVAGGVILVTVVAILLLKKKKKKTYTLTVNKGDGVDGNPGTGTNTYNDGQEINYSYTLQDNFDKMTITLDGNSVEYTSHTEVSGTIVMDRDHTLEVLGSQDNHNELEFVFDGETVTIIEGKEKDLYVKLSVMPEIRIVASVKPQSTESKITVIEGETLIFDQGNYMVFQTVTLRAAEDSNKEDEIESLEIIDENGVVPTRVIKVTIDDKHKGYNGPKVEITDPANGDSVTGIFNIQVNAEDTLFGIEKVGFYIDDTFVDSDRSAPYLYRWDTRELNTGSYAIKVIATNTNDDAVVDSVTVNVIRNDQKPTVSIISPSDGETVSGNITIRVDASDDVGITKVELYVDDDPVESDTTQPYRFGLDTNALPNGSHFIKVYAHDTAGQTAFAEIVLTVDNRGEGRTAGR